MLLVVGLVVVLGGTVASIGLFVLPDSGPHRVAGKQPSPPAKGGSPRWEVPSHTWVALSEAWAVPQVDHSPYVYGMASDGKRVFTLREPVDGQGGREPEGELTAYDGASGKRLWRKELPWIENASPVGGRGIVVVPTGGEGDDPTSSPKAAEYVAFDSVTGAERWRVEVGKRATFPTVTHRPGNAPGVFHDGVFYYGDGGRLVGVDPASGRVRYQRNAEDKVIVAGPVVAGGRITVIAEHPSESAGSVRTAFMFEPDLTSEVSSSFPEDAAPDTITASGDIFVAWGPAAGSGDALWATDARTGEGLWSKKLPDLADYGGVLGKVIVVRDAQENNEQKFLGYDLVSGKKLWTTVPPDSEIYNVGIADGTLFALAHGITIIDATNGEEVSAEETNRGGGFVASAAGRIVVYNHDGITGFE